MVIGTIQNISVEPDVAFLPHCTENLEVLKVHELQVLLKVGIYNFLRIKILLMIIHLKIFKVQNIIKSVFIIVKIDKKH